MGSRRIRTHRERLTVAKSEQLTDSERKARINARNLKWQAANREHVRRKWRENYAKRQARKLSAGL